METQQLKNEIIIPTLQYIQTNSDLPKSFCCKAAVKLLLMTAAAESRLGRYIKQKSGIALSIYQIEPFTHKWILRRIKKNEKLQQIIIDMKGKHDPVNSLLSDLDYATAICRLVYWYKTSEPLPTENDLSGLWLYYKKFYNTYKGKTTRKRFFEACKKCKVL